MVNVFGSIDISCVQLPGQSKDINIGICCFSAKHKALRRTGKNRLVLNQDNVSEWSDMSTYASTINIQLSVLVRYNIYISSKCNVYDIVESLLI